MTVTDLVQTFTDPAVTTALADVAAAVLPAWDAPNPAPIAPPGSGGFEWFLGVAKWATFGMAIAALLFIGGTFLWHKRQGEGHEMGPVLLKWVTGITIGGAASLIVSALTAAAGF